MAQEVVVKISEQDPSRSKELLAAFVAELLFSTGEDIVIQVFRETGDKIRVAVKAPREMSVLRGEVLERTGEDRPSGVLLHKK